MSKRHYPFLSFKYGIGHRSQLLLYNYMLHLLPAIMPFYLVFSAHSTPFSPRFLFVTCVSVSVSTSIVQFISNLDSHLVGGGGGGRVMGGNFDSGKGCRRDCRKRGLVMGGGQWVTGFALLYPSQLTEL